MSFLADPPCLDMIARISRGSSFGSASSHSHISHNTHGRDSHPHYNIEPSPEYKDGIISKVPSFAIETAKFPSNEDCVVMESAKTTHDESPISLSDPRWAGLIVHSVAMGMVSTVLPLTVYPFLTVYLNMEGTQTLSARTLLAIPWCLRPFFRIFMDCVPLVFGRHHRPYMVMGWVIASLSLGAIYFIDIPEPYYGDFTLTGKPQVNMTSTELATLNKDAPSHGALYVMFMAIATVGYVLADVAADTLIDETAQRYFPTSSPEHESPFVPRVTMQRYAAMMFTYLFMGFGMSGLHYGGDFDFTLDYNEVMLITGVIASVPIPFVWLMIEEVPCERQSFLACFRRMWDLFQNRAIAYVIACRFIGGVFGGISATPVNPIAIYWAGIQPLNDNVVSFVATGLILGFMLLVDKKGWTLNYRLLIIGVSIGVLVLDCGATLFTIWDIVRSQWLWIGLPVIESLPSALDYVILTVILTEITEPGTEDLMRALVTAVSFLATPVGLTITKFIDAIFDVSNEDLARDTTHVRVHATAVFGIAYVCQLLSLAWLLALPRHSEEAREWKQTSGSSPRLGALLIATLALSLVCSIVVHGLSVIDTTSCLRIAGGNGCSD